MAGGRRRGAEKGVRSAGEAIIAVAAGEHSVAMPSRPADKHMDNLGWLGTYRERLRMARRDERDDIGFLINRMTARYHLRRAEPA